MDQENRREIYDQASMMMRLGPVGSLMSFNMEYGFLEAILRGTRAGFLTEFEYGQLCLCESLDDVKLCLGDTDYKSSLTGIQAGQLTQDSIWAACQDKNIKEFEWIHRQAVGSLTTFMEFITYEYLIKSIQFIITSIIRGSKPEILLAKCHPLGKSPQLKQILTFENDLGEDDGLLSLYRTVLVDTPVAKYFALYFNSELGPDQQAREIKRHYDEQEVEIITNMLIKLWLEDFYAYTQSIGGETAEIMKELLEFEADRRAIEITINSLRTSLNEDINRHSRQDLFCAFGKLYPNGTLKEFPKVKLITELGDKLKPYKVYHEMWKNAETDPARYGRGGLSESKEVKKSDGEQWEKWSPIIESFNDSMKRYHVDLCRKAFEGQSHFAGFYAYIKLKGQEEDNLKWIFAMIAMGRGAKDRQRWVKTF